MPDLLIELFSEEIPARMQTRAGEDLKKLVTNGLVEAGLTYAYAAAFSTPRRLCLTVAGVVGEAPTLREERKGPRADAPDKAIEGFLRGAGLTRDQVEERETPKGNILFAVIEKPGRPAGDIIAEATPLGLMGGLPGAQVNTTSSTGGEGAGGTRSETLYIEVRQDNMTEDPAEWFDIDKDG